MTPLTIAIAVVVFVPMLVEAAVSRRHDRELRATGAAEPAGDVYATMQVAYPGAFLMMLAEGVARHARVDTAVWVGAAIFIAAKALKYWATATLGVRWTFRILVPPGSKRIVSGPYRWVRHPNYIAVAGELVGTALMMRAFVTGPVATLGFIALMLARIRVEDRALQLERR